MHRIKQHICETCGLKFSGSYQLAGHKQIHTTKVNSTPPKCCCIITKREISSSCLQKFQENIKFCNQCELPLSSNRKFCDRSCSAKFNNSGRSYYSSTNFKNTQSINSINTHIENKIPYHNLKSPKALSKRINEMIQGDYTKIYSCRCKHCNTKFFNRKKTKFCVNCRDKYSTNGKAAYKFTFNILDYPDLFDLSTIKDGWHNPYRAKNGDFSGVSKDHKISINEAIKNNYDPYYITHPKNCELMPQIDNMKKNTKCSITYEELIKAVDSYELRICAPLDGIEPPMPIKALG
jgi:hypothetical protein